MSIFTHFSMWVRCFFLLFELAVACKLNSIVTNSRSFCPYNNSFPFKGAAQWFANHWFSQAFFATVEFTIFKIQWQWNARAAYLYTIKWQNWIEIIIQCVSLYYRWGRVFFLLALRHSCLRHCSKFFDFYMAYTLTNSRRTQESNKKKTNALSIWAKGAVAS